MKKATVLILLSIGFIVYFNCFFNGFIWDDEEQIVNNHIVHSIKNIPAFFSGSTFNTGGTGSLVGIYYKPLMNVVFSLLYSVFGNRPLFFHLFQVALHLINSIIIYWLFKNFLPLWLSFFLSLIFLIHPFNVETVVYISALQEPLFLFFGLLALLSIIKIAEERRPFLLLVPVSFLLFSILAKETGLVFVLIIFIYLFIFKKGWLFPYSILTFILLNLYFVLRLGLANIPFSSQYLSPITRVDLTTRLLSIPKIVYFYFNTFLFPKDLAIAQQWVVNKINVADFYWPLIFDCLIFAFFAYFVFLAVKKFNNYPAKALIFFFCWFIISLCFHCQIFPLDMTASDRWFYLPMVGLLGMTGTIVGFPLFNKDGEFIKKRGLLFILTILIALLSVRTIIRIFNWHNGLALFSHDIKISKDAFDLENNLGVELFRVNKINQARIHFENSTKLAPYWWTNWNNLGAVYEKRGDLIRAANYYKQAIKNGDYYLAYENYSGVLIKQGKIKEARDFLQNQALKKFPHNQKLRLMWDYVNN